MIQDLIDAVRNFLAKLFGGTGTSADIRRLEKTREKLDAARRKQNDEIEVFRSKIKQIGVRSQNLKSDYNTAPPIEKPLLERQMRQAMDEADGLDGQKVVLFANIDSLTKAIGKIDEVLISLSHGMTEVDVDNIAMIGDEAFAVADDALRAVASMDRVVHPAMAIEAERENVEDRAPVRTKSVDQLPADLEARMKRFEMEPPQT